MFPDLGVQVADQPAQDALLSAAHRHAEETMLELSGPSIAS